MSLPLSPTAQEALGAASTDALFRGDGHVTPEHLLAALVASEDGAAVRFLRTLCVDRDALRERLDQCLAREEAARPILTDPRMIELGEVGIRRLVGSATDLAAGYAATTVVPEHLLLAVARQPDTAAGRLLAELGATDQEITRLIEAGLPEDWRDRAGMRERLERLDARVAKRAAVAAMHTFAGLHLLAVGWGLAGLLLLPVTFNSEDKLTLPFTVKFLWAASITLVTAVAFIERRRWGWASCTGFLFVQAASSTVWLAACPLVMPWNFFLGSLFWNPLVWNTGVIWLVTAACFASRLWFPIEPRERWRVVMREGGWVLASTTVVEVATLAWLAWGWWSMRP